MSEKKYTVQDDVPLSSKIIQVLASIEDVPPNDLEPLYDSVDPDALDSIFANRGGKGHVKFYHSNHCITATSNREIIVESKEEASET